MRVEGEDDRGAAEFTGLSEQPLGQPGVTTMNAVEIADRESAAAKIGWQGGEGV